MKFFVQRYVSSTTTFTTRVQNKLVVGLATWREQREVGRRTFEAALVVDVFSNKGVQVVKEIVKTALLAEKLVATIHIDDPVARKPQDKPPDEAVLEVHEDVDEERVGDALLLTGDTTFLEEKLLLIGGSEYDIDADVYRFPLSDDVTKDCLIENLQNLVDLDLYPQAPRIPQSPMCQPPVMHRINRARARTACRAAKRSPEGQRTRKAKGPLGSSHV
jgi:hypothetical protein